MIKLLANLKNSFGRVLIIIIFLCIQAWADLLLPDYTSKIVNTGIQSGGIESAVPEIISKTDMESLSIFSKDYDFILQNYILSDDKLNNNEQERLEKYLGKNFEKDENEVYVLKDIDKEQKEKLQEKLSAPLMELATISNKESQDKIKEQIIR